MRIPVLSKLYEDRNVIFELTRKNIKTQYRESVLGLVWTVLNPLLNTLVMYVVFTHLLPRSDNYFILYLLCGNILFAALRASTQQALEASVKNRGLLLRTKIDPYVFPTSNCLSSIANFLFSLIALIPFMLYLSIKWSINVFTHRLFYIILMIPAFWLFELGIGLMLDALYVFFRDLKHIYGVFLTLWMYITPIFYKIEGMPPNIQKVINFNPMYRFATYFRDCVYLGATGSPTFEPPFLVLLQLYIIGVVSILVGIVVFKLLKKKIITRI